jgi:hypothetical protein
MDHSSTSNGSARRLTAKIVAPMAEFGQMTGAKWHKWLNIYNTCKLTITIIKQYIRIRIIIVIII